MARAEATVDELVGMIERGELRLPEMQRQYVWAATRVRDLLDSLYRGYPSGAILVWETSDSTPLRAFAVEQQANAFSTTRLLLDGQQRLTSLSAVLRGTPVHVRGRTRPIEILFNLDHPDELTFAMEADADEEKESDEVDATEGDLQRRINQMAFVVGTRKLEQLPQWVKVSDVFRSDGDMEFIERAGVEHLRDPRNERYRKRLARLRAIKKYVYRMDVLERGLSYEEVTEIFVRVNSLGARLRGSDLALAQITSRWRGALEVFEGQQKKCQQQGYYLDLSVHLKNLVAFATDQSRFHTVGRLSLERLQDAWQRSAAGLEFAINFLKSNVGIDSPALLASPYAVITVAAFGARRDYHLTSAESASLRQWILLANAKGRYSRGSSETLLDQDLATIRQGGDPSALIDRLRTQVGRLDIAPEELEGKRQVSALFKTMFLAFRAGGARDWHSQLAISLDHAGASHQLQFHHIFPRAVLKEAQVGDADDIANLAFIAGKTNRKISDKPPAAYLPGLIETNGAAAFDAQCIPTEPEWREVAGYRDFITERRRRIAARLNEFLGVEP